MSGNCFRTRSELLLKLVVLAMVSGGAVLMAGIAARGASEKPHNEVGVTSVEPSLRADRESNITVEFSEGLVPDDSLDRSVVDPPLQFDPPIEGVARWVEPNVLRFYPDAPLRPATEYQLKVKSSQDYLDGKRIKEDRTFRFATPNLQITDVNYWTEPATGFIFPHAQIHILLAFNYPIKPDELKRKLKITGSDNATRRALDFEVRQEGGPPLVLSPEALREFEAENGTSRYSYMIITEGVLLTRGPQRYRLRVASGLSCEDCGEELQEDIVQTIIVSPKGELVVHSVRPQSAGTHFNLQINVSAALDHEEIRDYLIVEPEMKYTLQTSRWGALISGDFRSGQSYTVKIKKGLAAQNGQVMEREFSTVVEIPDLPPSIEFTSPGMFLPREGSGNIELKTVNIDEVLIEVEQVFENNVVHYLTGGESSNGYGYRYSYGSGMNRYGRRIFYKEAVLEHEPNTPLTSTIDVSDILGDTSRGIYVINISNKEQRWISDKRKVMLTDIGITARKDRNTRLLDPLLGTRH